MSLNKTEQNEELDELKTLKLKRGQLKSQLTRFKNFLDTIEPENIDYIDLESRFSRMDGILDKFDDVQGRIELITEDYEIEDPERVSFENSFFNLNKIVQKHLTGKQNDTGSTTSESNRASTVNMHLENIESKVKLPTLTLPTFTGHFDEWLSFQDLFLDIVDSNDKISKVQKFYYLKSCLKGEASELIRGIQVTSDNYETAWSILKEQYENKKRIIAKHMREIFELPSVKSESAQLLKTFIHNFNKNFRALTTLGQPTQYWDTPLICIIKSKIDTVSKREWDKLTKKDEVQDITVNKLIDYLIERADLMDNENDESKRTKDVPRTNKSINLFTRNVKCSFCQQQHFNQECKDFGSKTAKQKFEEVKKHKLCTNCLRPGHFVYDCRTRGCKFCGKKHHSLLHNIEQTNNAVMSTEEPNDTATPPTKTACTSVQAQASTNNVQILLATALIYLLDSDGNKVECRALLDSGSQSNFVTSEFARKLKLKFRNTNIAIAGVNNLSSNVTKMIKTTLGSINEQSEFNTTFLIIDKITDDLPHTAFNISELELPRHINLADSYVSESRTIDILIGAPLFFDILKGGQIKLGKNKPILQETKLGWVLAGTMPFVTNQQVIRCNLVTGFDELHNKVKEFWELEEISEQKIHTREELECEEHFVKTFKRDANGRFELSLPLKDNWTHLGNSRDNAIKQFYSLERRLNRNETLKQEYEKFMKEYEFLGHMTEISDTGVNVDFYLPHHGVIKESSTTTKLRVVFNASAISDTGISLNNVLKIGPVVQNDLFTIAMNFRVHNVAFTADIEKMYRQVNIKPEERSLQRIVWRNNNTDMLKHYELNTITYGTASASFMACRCLVELAKQNETIFPEACYAIRNEFYMDDLISGRESIEQALKLKREISNILESGALPLRKWNSNCKELLDCSPTELPEYFISNTEDSKTLGLIWNPKSDAFSYKVNTPECRFISKRVVLSTIAKIFDPLGLINPIIVQAKLLLQEIWQQQIGWDDALTNEILKRWQVFYNGLSEINNISIPRQVITRQLGHTDLEIHGFSDSSELALGACIYIRTLDISRNYCVKLLCAKSKIAPLKRVTLPRLELNAALLLSRLVDKVNKNFRCTVARTFLWSDSTIVLHWLASEPNTWNTYVANRTSEIQKLTELYQWRHARTNSIKSC